MSATESGGDDRDEAKAFQARLFQFHRLIGAPLKRIPTLGGRELDVYHLYKKVESMGGYDVVSQGRLWGEVARSFNLPSSVTSASYAIRQHYVRLLEKFEAYEKDPNYLSFHHSSVATPTSRTPLPHAVSLTPQAHVPSPAPPTQGVVSHQRGRWDKIACSLTSGFPNEVDFAFNILTVMAFKEPYSMHIAELPHVLDLMLAHVGVFPQDDSHGDLGLEGLYKQWYSMSPSDYLEFWGVSVPEWVFGVVFNTAINTTPHIHSGLFSSGRDEHDWRVETYRTTQLATILNNISVDPRSSLFLSSHHGVLTFLLLACNSCQPSLISTGLDVLVSLAPHLSLSSPPLTSDLSPPNLEVLLHCLLECVLSSDRMIILKGLNVLSRLCWAPPNEVFAGCVQVEVWERLFQFLLLPDIQLILLSLDTLYQVTSYGSPQAAAAIFQVTKCVEILVCLLSLDIRRFGEKALAQLQVVRVTPSPATTSALPKSPLPPNNGTLSNLAMGKPKALVNPATSLGGGRGTGLIVTSPGGGKGTSLGGSGGVAGNKQTVKIGNCEIPVMPFHGNKSPAPQITNKSPAPQLARGPTVLTIQQIQNMLAKHISSSSSPSPQGCDLNKGSRVTISGGSNVSISRGTSPVANDNNIINKSVKNNTHLLRAFLAKNSNSMMTTTPFTATSLPQLATTSLGTVTPSTLSSTSLGTVTPSTLSSTSLVAPSTTTSLGTVRPSTLSSTSLVAPSTTTSLGTVTPSTLSSTSLVAPSTTTSLGTVTPSTLSSTSLVVPSTTTSLGTVTTSALSSTSLVAPSTTTSPGSPYSTLLLSTNSSDKVIPMDTTITPMGTKLNLPSKLSAGTVSMGTQTTSNHTGVPSSPSLHLAEEFASEWLESCYMESRGSYLSQLEMFSLYLIASTKAGVLASLTHTQFNAVLKKMFPDALSTRVTVGNQTVYMMVGLAKKKASGGQSLKDTVPVSSTSGGGGAGGVVTQQIIKDSRGPLCSSATPTTGLVGSRMDYSTDSPLSVSNKAEDVGVARSQRDNVSSNRDESNVGVASSHRNEQVNGLDHSPDPDEEGVVPKAKRIKLMSDEVENIMSGGHNSKQGGGRGDVGGGSDGCVGGGGGDICVGGGGVDVCVGGDSVSKTIKLLNMEDKKSLNRHHHLLSQGHGISPASTATPTSSRTGSPVSMDMPSWNKDGSRDGSSLRWSPSPTPSDHSSTTSSAGLASSIGHSSSLTSSAGLASSIGHSSSLTSSTVLASSIGHASSLTGSAEQTGQTDPQKYTRTCYWNNCLSYHTDSSSLLHHVIHTHLPTPCGGYPYPCQWRECTSTMPRYRPSLIAHVMTCHIGNHPSFMPNIQKTLARLKSVPRLETDVENVLTKAIRLTAALVLRNISQVLPDARRCLRRYEGVLSEVALSGSEASTAALECLEYVHLPP